MANGSIDFGLLGVQQNANRFQQQAMFQQQLNAQARQEKQAKQAQMMQGLQQLAGAFQGRKDAEQAQLNKDRASGLGRCYRCLRLPSS